MHRIEPGRARSVSAGPPETSSEARMVPHLRTALAVLLLSAGTLPVSAQSAQGAAPAKRPDPTDARATVPPVVHRPAIAKAAPPAEVPVGSWSQANDTVWRIGGWRAYAREAAAPSPAPAASQPGARP